MKKSINKPSFWRAALAIFMLVVGFGGIGYVPGKSPLFTAVFVIVMVIGAASGFLFIEDVKRYKKICRLLSKERSEAARKIVNVKRQAA